MRWKIIANGSTENMAGAAKAVSLGAEILDRGGSAVDAIETSISAMEDDPRFDAGTGCDINIFGLILMDASIMDGKNLKAGAIGAVRGVKNPIMVARRLMEHTTNVLLVGEGAEEFAQVISRTDLKVVVNYDARTEEKKRKFREEIGAIIDQDLATEILSELGGTPMVLYRFLGEGKFLQLQQELPSLQEQGTVSVSALDMEGNFAAGASTGGWTLTLPGRIGDSPLVGCGAYADNNSGCSSTAGIRGEENIRLGGLTRRVCDLMGRGQSAQEAVEAVTEYALDRLELNLKRGSIVAIDKSGGLGYNSKQVAPSLSLALMEEGMKKPLLPLQRSSSHAHA